MNYITEINSFRKFTTINPLPGATQSLWFLLMHINNKCGWIKWFKVSNKRLAKELLMTEKTVMKHRGILLENGLIFYRSHKGKKESGEYNLAAISQLISEFSDETSVKNTEVDETCVNITEVSGETSVKITEVDETCVKITDINKLVRSNSNTTTIENSEKEDFKKMVEFFNNNFHPITAYEAERLIHYDESFESGVIIMALQEAIKSGVRSMKYIEGILNNWILSNLKTVEDVNVHMKAFSDKQNKNKFESIPGSKPKNKFHDFKQRDKKYTNDELKEKLARKRGNS